MAANETRILRLQNVSEDRVFVDVGHHDAVAVFLRKLIGQVNARATMGGLVLVVGDGLDVIVNVGTNVRAALTVIESAWDHIPEVRNDTCGQEDLTVVVEVEAPRIAEAMRDDFEEILCRVITPHTAVDKHAVFDRNLGGERITLAQDFAAVQRLAHDRSRREALAPVEPTIRPPVEAIENLMTILNAPAAQAYFGLPVGFIVTILVRHEEKIRWCAKP